MPDPIWSILNSDIDRCEKRGIGIPTNSLFDHRVTLAFVAETCHTILYQMKLLYMN